MKRLSSVNRKVNKYKIYTRGRVAQRDGVFNMLNNILLLQLIIEGLSRIRVNTSVATEYSRNLEMIIILNSFIYISVIQYIA